MTNEIRKREEMLEGEMEYGFSLIEVMTSIAVMSVLFLISVTAIGKIKDRSYSESIVTTVQAISNECRSFAISQGVNCGIVFKEENNEVLVRIYKDGDYDGINKDDIKTKKDTPLTDWEKLTKEDSRIAIPEGATKDPSDKQFESKDPIKFGRGDILTFSPAATATPGTLYIADGYEESGFAIRVAGIDGRIKIYRFRGGVWSEVARW